MTKGDILDLRIENMGSGGEGIAKIGGFPVFIKDSVPGDLCRVKIVKVKKNLAYGRMLEVLLPSKDRVSEKCPLAKSCGGCSMQAVSYERQLKFKYERVCDCLKRIGGVPEEILDRAGEGTVGMEEPFRYRNKAQYPIGMDRDGNVVAGFYAARSHDIVPVSDCLLLPEQFGDILSGFLDFMRLNGVSAYDEASGKGLVRHLVIKKAFATGEILVVIVINGDSLPHEDELISTMKAFEGVSSVVLNINKAKTNVIMGSSERVIFGDGHITDILCGLKYRISPLSFYQVNPRIASGIYEAVLEFAGLTGNEEVWDICCGIGTISLYLAKHAKRVLGIEIVPEAIKDAKRNAGLNGIENAEFICGAAEDILYAFSEDKKAGDHTFPDVIVLDPPRSGMELKAIDAVLKMAPSKIVYVSCDPATMSRDIKILTEENYSLTRFRPYDQFCQSGHVETVVSLSLKKDSPKIEISMKPGEDSLYEPQDKGTYEKIKAYVLEKYGFKVSNLYIAQTKGKCGLDKRLNYNLSKKDDPHVPECPKEKEDAIMDAFRHFSII